VNLAADEAWLRPWDAWWMPGGWCSVDGVPWTGGSVPDPGGRQLHGCVVESFQAQEHRNAQGNEPDSDAMFNFSSAFSKELMSYFSEQCFAEKESTDSQRSQAYTIPVSLKEIA